MPAAKELKIPMVISPLSGAMRRIMVSELIPISLESHPHRRRCVKMAGLTEWKYGIQIIKIDCILSVGSNCYVTILISHKAPRLVKMSEVLKFGLVQMSKVATTGTIPLR